jgi:hypothetical protein
VFVLTTTGILIEDQGNVKPISRRNLHQNENAPDENVEGVEKSGPQEAHR